MTPSADRDAVGVATLPWAVRRMLQALDAYWMHCDGLPKGRYPRGRHNMEDWWSRFERYRRIVESETAKEWETQCRP